MHDLWICVERSRLTKRYSFENDLEDLRLVLCGYNLTGTADAPGYMM